MSWPSMFNPVAVREYTAASGMETGVGSCHAAIGEAEATLVVAVADLCARLSKSLSMMRLHLILSSDGVLGGVAMLAREGVLGVVAVAAREGVLGIVHVREVGVGVFAMLVRCATSGVVTTRAAAGELVT